MLQPASKGLVIYTIKHMQLLIIDFFISYGRPQTRQMNPQSTGMSSLMSLDVKPSEPFGRGEGGPQVNRPRPGTPGQRPPRPGAPHQQMRPGAPQKQGPRGQQPRQSTPSFQPRPPTG